MPKTFPAATNRTVSRPTFRIVSDWRKCAIFICGLFVTAHINQIELRDEYSFVSVRLGAVVRRVRREDFDVVEIL